MSMPYVSLPTEQAVWTRADVEKYLAEKGAEAVFGRHALDKWAEKKNLIPAGSAPSVVRMPAAVVPELAAVTDPANERKDAASVYVDTKAAVVVGTDLKVLMRVAVNDVQARRDHVSKNLLAVIPPADGRTPFRFDAHVLLRLCLSSLASVGGDPTSRSREAKVTFWPHPTDPTGVMRVEVSGDDNEVRMVGAIMPMNMKGDHPTTDPLGLRDDAPPKVDQPPAEPTLLTAPSPLTSADVQDL